MGTILVAIALILAFEGLLLAAFPQMMRRMMRRASETSPTHLRTVGLAAAVLGVFLLWIARGFPVPW
jgi:uncharacterized protein YjeT (DUF2065 family)